MAQVIRAQAAPLNFGPQFPGVRLPFTRSTSAGDVETQQVNPDFLLNGFTLHPATRESTKSSILQHAGMTLKNLKAVTAKSRNTYADALKVAGQALQNLQRDEDILEQASIAYTYFQVTLSEGALARGADVLCLNRRNKDLLGSDIRVVYRSSTTPLFQSLPSPLTSISIEWPGSVSQLLSEDPGLSPCSSSSPSPVSTEVGEIHADDNLLMYLGTSKEVLDPVEVYVEDEFGSTSHQ
ncbi:hypothetical protein FIBSPDRAFT_897994 [Athelia psychrophila]|uniref:Uncharacterized protein n=1 Tax=Athelia psychrophila TaxID=1759441 RepID=A0A166BKR1_9AGAM|nr:hypothetical protein FIBSPDRAFT_897994 [Fibularhizoctonia sp. CBS 109695]